MTGSSGVSLHGAGGSDRALTGICGREKIRGVLWRPKLGHQLTIDDILKLLAERIRGAVQPEKIILFGSRARGDARPDSDIDIFIQVETGRDVGQVCGSAYAAIHSLQSLHGKSVDIVVRDRQFVERYAGLVGTILPAVEKEGRALYARQQTRRRTRGRLVAQSG